MATSRTTPHRGLSTWRAIPPTTVSFTGRTPGRVRPTPSRLPTPPFPRSRSSSWSTGDGRTASSTRRSSAASSPIPTRRRPPTWTRTRVASWGRRSGGPSMTTGPSGRESRSSTLASTNRTVMRVPSACRPPPFSAAEPARALRSGSYRRPPVNHASPPRKAFASWGISPMPLQWRSLSRPSSCWGCCCYDARGGRPRFPDASGQWSGGGGLRAGGHHRGWLDWLRPGPGGRLRARRDPRLVCRCHPELAAGPEPDAGCHRTASPIWQPGPGAGAGPGRLVHRRPLCRTARRALRRAGGRPDRRAGGRLLQPLALRGAGAGRGAGPNRLTGPWAGASLYRLVGDPQPPLGRTGTASHRTHMRSQDTVASLKLNHEGWARPRSAATWDLSAPCAPPGPGRQRRLRQLEREPASDARPDPRGGTPHPPGRRGPRGNTSSTRHDDPRSVGGRPARRRPPGDREDHRRPGRDQSPGTERTAAHEPLRERRAELCRGELLQAALADG